MKKLAGYMLGLVGLIIYILLVSRLIDAVFPRHALLDIIYYSVAGIGWIFPAMWVIRWWVKPKNN